MFIRTLLLLVVTQLIAATPLMAKSGEALFRQHCAACHGYDGSGGVGVPLTLPDFQYSVTDDYLRTTIRLGRPGRVMPAFPSLTDDDITQLVKYIRGWSYGKPYNYPDKPISGDVKHGEKLYMQYCAACHGQHGEGGQGTGVTFSRPRNLPIIAPALNNPGFLKAASDQFIKEALMNGRDGTPMISYRKHGLSEQDINDIVVYVRSFENIPLPLEQQPVESVEATMVFDSPYDLETTIKNIKEAAVGNNFRLIREQSLDYGLVEPEKENTKQRIVYFCNFSTLNKALAIDPRVGLFLPCRITAVEKNGKVKVYAINPKRLSSLFNNAELNKLCNEMSETYLSIIEDATL